MSTFETVCCGFMLYIVIASMLLGLRLRNVARTAVYKDEEYSDVDDFASLFINAAGELREQDGSYMYVSVKGDLCEGNMYLI